MYKYKECISKDKLTLIQILYYYLKNS